MEHLHAIKDALITEAYKQIECLEYVNAKELGEVIDMIKDIEEAIYYRTITISMGESGMSKEINSMK